MSGSTVVIPTYNREALVGRAIRSALVWRAAGFDLDIIVVDDASSDGTVERLERDFASEIGSGALTIVKLPVNRGVTGAKNAGAFASRREWVIFLDSDDELIADAMGEVAGALRQHGDLDVLLFPCTDADSGVRQGRPDPAGFYDARTIFEPGLPGEVLIVARRDRFREIPFAEDLRGCESLMLKKMVCAGRKVWISDRPARRYYQPGSGRLSVGDGFRRRYKYIGKYHLRLVCYFRQAGLLFAAKSASKAAAYGALHVTHSLRKALGQ